MEEALAGLWYMATQVQGTIAGAARPLLPGAEPGR